MTLQGIDFEGRITDWQKAKALGKSYAISRCVGEQGAVDPDCAPNMRGAAAAGLIPGGYHFIAHGTARAHCRIFVDAMGDPSGKLVMVDVETPNAHPHPDASDVAEWYDEYRHHHPTHPVVLYSRQGFWYSIGNPTIHDPYTVLMTSRYPFSAPNLTYPSDTGMGWNDRYGGLVPKFWQYTGSRNLGLGASVDLSAYHGTLAELRDLTLDLPDTSENALATITIDNFDAPRAVTGTNVTAWLPDGTNKVIPSLSSIASGTATIDQPGAPRGSGWLRLAARPDAGWYVSAADVTLASAPPTVDPTPFDQAAVDKAVADAVATDRTKARIVYG
jgi:GH25 family lysozyme M1 (1,4-beta-N-acetylmuramidase)